MSSDLVSANLWSVAGGREHDLVGMAQPAAKPTKLHEGKWLREQIAASGKSQAAFARASQIPLQTIKGWLMQSELRIRLDYLHRLAAGLGQTRQSFDMALDRARVYAMLQDEQTRDRWKRQIKAAEKLGPHASVADQIAAGLPTDDPPPFLDQNIELGSMQRYADIPMFDLSVACGGWADVGEAMEVCDPASIEQGLFRVRLSGDSMVPKYKSGEIVEFKCLRYGEDPIEPGKDYYVQREDGMATFKRVEKVDETGITLRAINKRKYPERMDVPHIAVVRMAKAMAKVVLVE
jgi:SOS-response transcriptional repressor LexA